VWVVATTYSLGCEITFDVSFLFWWHFLFTKQKHGQKCWDQTKYWGFTFMILWHQACSGCSATANVIFYRQSSVLQRLCHTASLSLGAVMTFDMTSSFMCWPFSQSNGSISNLVAMQITLNIATRRHVGKVVLCKCFILRMSLWKILYSMHYVK